jgi:hypothetical protein
MTPEISGASGEPIWDALQRIQVFVAVLLDDRSGPLTCVQRDLLTSTQAAAERLEHELLASSSAASHGNALKTRSHVEA